jgi:hypothetical protein
VFMGYVCGHEHALLDFRLSLPEEWAELGYPLSPGHPVPSMTCRDGLSTLPGHG